MPDPNEPEQQTPPLASEAKNSKQLSELLDMDSDSDAIFNYLTTLQSVITRLAANSGNCKTLCVTLVSAIVVVITNKAKPEFAWVTFFPIITLGLLDAYYLGLERSFRETYNIFTKKLVHSTATRGELFKMVPTNPDWLQKKLDKLNWKKGFLKWLLNNIAVVVNTFTSCFSPAIWLFYGPLFAIVQLGKNLIFSIK